MMPHIIGTGGKMPKVIGTGGAPVNNDGNIIIKGGKMPGVSGTGGAPTHDGWEVAVGEIVIAKMGHGDSMTGHVTEVTSDSNSCSITVEFDNPVDGKAKHLKLSIASAT